MDPSTGVYGRDWTGGGVFAPPQGYALSGKIMLSTVVVLFTVVLLILFLQFYVRWHLLRFASRGPLPAGLDPEALESLPVLVYSDGGKEDEVLTECAVCLNEFEEGEKVRSLPRCGHRFHIECIDMWFHSHATCPLCRSPVEPAPAANSVQTHVAEAAPPPPTDPCSTCRTEDGIGSSSSSSGVPELRIDVSARRGFDEEVMSPGCFKSPGSRIRAVRRLLSRDLKLHRGGGPEAEPDMERGEGPERATPPTPPPSPLTPPLPLNEVGSAAGRGLLIRTRGGLM